MKKVYIKPSATFVNLDQRDIIATSTNTFGEFGTGTPGDVASDPWSLGDESNDWGF